MGADRDNPIGSISGAIIGIAWRAILLALIVYFLAQGVTYAYSYGHGLLYAHSMEAYPGTDVSFLISEEDGNADIARNLEEAKLIDNQQAFLLQTRLYDAVYAPGTYTLNTSMTGLEIIEFLDEEGKKRSELLDKNLLDETAEETETALETDANGAEIVGGGDDYE